MGGLPRRFWEYVSRSTLKREFAAFLTGWLLTMATYLIFTAPSFDNQWRVLEAFLWPILGGAFGVFGLDWISKQTTIAGPPQGPDGDATKVETKVELPSVTQITTTTTKPDGE